MHAPKMSFVKAVITFFSEGTHGRKLGIPEFKDLSREDKVELSQLLNAVPGFEHEPYTGEATA